MTVYLNNSKYISAFEQGHASQKSILGGKGANLAEMTCMGLPVPPGCRRKILNSLRGT